MLFPPTQSGTRSHCHAPRNGVPRTTHWCRMPSQPSPETWAIRHASQVPRTRIWSRRPRFPPPRVHAQLPPPPPPLPPPPIRHLCCRRDDPVLWGRGSVAHVMVQLRSSKMDRVVSSECHSAAATAAAAAAASNHRGGGRVSLRTLEKDPDQVPLFARRAVRWARGGLVRGRGTPSPRVSLFPMGELGRVKGQRLLGGTSSLPRSLAPALARSLACSLPSFPPYPQPNHTHTPPCLAAPPPPPPTTVAAGDVRRRAAGRTAES
jgi:hypothetical protein